MTKSVKEWEKFKVGAHTSKVGNPKCEILDEVTHTCHVSSALKIIEDREIRPTLIFDRSKLNDKRILVSWVSPNHWSTGYRYGNIRFGFPFQDLIRDKKCYWVEAIAYGIAACRILITDVDRDDELDRYNPTDKSGPWWYDDINDKHYCNGEICLEFMVESSINLRKLASLSFVDHHDTYCAMHRTSPSRCKELKLSAGKGSALFYTRAVVQRTDLSTLNRHFRNDMGKVASQTLFAMETFYILSCKADFKGTLQGDSEEGRVIATATMSAFTFGSKQDALRLCAMFEDEDQFHQASARLFAETSGFDNWQELIT